MKRVLVIAAHPDDEVLGCGATIAQHTQSGDKVSVVIIGEGLTSRRKLTEKEKSTGVLNLKSSAMKASKILGVSNLVFLDFADNKFDSVPFLEIIHKIEPIYEKISPAIVYTHFGGDVNIDHGITNRVAEVLTRPIAKLNTNLVLNFETPSSTEWNFTRNAFSPNYFVPISKKSLKKKIRAMLEYKKEMRPFPHPRSEEYIQALATVRGGQSGLRLAEAFRLQYYLSR